MSTAATAAVYGMFCLVPGFVVAVLADSVFDACFACFYSNMESSWNKRGYGSAISRSVEVWVFGAKILFKEIKLRKVGVPS